MNIKIRRLLSILMLSFMMLVSTIPAFAETSDEQNINTQETTESINSEETLEEDYSISLLGGDITPPVVLDVELLNNGFVASNDRFVYLKIKGHDDSAFDPDKCTMIFNVPNCMRPDQGSGHAAESIVDHGDGTYTLKFRVEQSWYGPYVITEIMIADEFSNETRIETMNHDTGVFYYKGEIERAVSNVTASNIVINNSTSDFNATLTDSILSIPFDFSADITAPQNFTINDGEEMYITFRSSDRHSIEMNAIYQQGKLECSPSIEYFAEVGTYVLDSIVYRDEFLAINGNVPKIIVTKTNTDNIAPTVDDIWFELNGVRQNECFEAQIGTNDVVEVFAKVSDVSDIYRVEINLQTTHPSYSNPQTLQLNKVQNTTDTYSIVVPLDIYGATVWFVDDCYAYDIYGNMEPERNLSPYFILRDVDGDTTIPTVQLNGIDVDFGKDDYIHFEGNITVECITSINDILNQIGESLHNLTIPNGRTFEGWYIGHSEQAIYNTSPTAAANTEFILKYTNGDTLYITPIYDKLVIQGRVLYFGTNQDGYIEPYTATQEIVLDHGKTVQDAINKIDTSSIPHSPDCVLDKYICESYDNLAQELNPSNTVIWLNSVYSSFPVFGNYQYYNEDGEWTGDMLTVSLTSGDTHQDALNEVYNELNNLNLSHDASLGQFIDWEAMPNWYMDDLSAPAEPGQWYDYRATYEKREITIDATYIDTNGEVQTASLGNVTITNGTTYQDLLNQFATQLNAITHSTNHNFKQWNVEYVQLTDLVLDDYVIFTAEYDQYPVSIVYTYQDVNGPKTELVKLNVNANTDMETIFNQYVNPTHNSNLNFKGWKFFLDGATTQTPSASNSRYEAAAVYDNYEPTWIITAYVNKQNECVQGPFVVYTPGTATHDSSDVVIDTWLTHSKDAAMLAVQNDSKYTINSFEILDFNLNKMDVFSNYYTAPQVILLAMTDKSEVTFEYPDGTSEMILMDAWSQYTLPTSIDNKDVEWTLDHPFTYENIAGGDVIEIFPPYFTLKAEFVTNQGGSNPSNPSTPTPNPTPTPVVTPTPTPAPNPTPAPITGPVELDAPVEQQTIQNITNASQGDIITVDMEKSDGKIATVVTKEMLQAAQDKDVDIEMDMGDYSWVINGEDIRALDDIHDVDLEVTLNTNAIPSNTVQTLSNGKPTLQLSLTYSGDFGFKADLRINVGSQYAGQNVSLYYYDSLGKLVFIDDSPVDQNGNVSLTFSHASDYVIIIDAETNDTNNTENNDETVNTIEPEIVEKESSMMLPTIGIVVITIVIAAVIVIIKNKKGQE